MILGDKEFEFNFKMAQIKAVQKHMGISEFSEIPSVFSKAAKDPLKIAELTVACIYYGSEAFESIEEIEKLVESTEDILPAFNAFISAFNKFYGIGKGEETGEGEAPSTGATSKK